MGIEVVNASVFNEAAAAHAVEHKQVRLDQVLERCNKALNAKIVAFRQNKGMNEIAMQVNVEYMRHEFDIIDTVIEELKKAGYAVKKDEADCRDETTYWLRIFTS